MKRSYANVLIERCVRALHDNPPPPARSAIDWLEASAEYATKRRHEVVVVLAEFLAAIREPEMVRRVEELVCCDGECQDPAACGAYLLYDDVTHASDVIDALVREIGPATKA